MRAPHHRQGLLDSMRVRIVLAVVLLLAGSAAVSILVLRSVLLDRLDEEIGVRLRQEVEEFELLRGGVDPRTGTAFAELEALFDVYFAREVPDEGETLLAFVDDRLYESARAKDAVGAGRLDQTIEYWLSLRSRKEGQRDTGGGDARYVAIPIELGGQSGLFVVANFPAFERSEINEAVRTQAVTQFATIAIASLVGLALAGRVLRPLRSLADTAKSFSETDLTQRIPVRGDDEASRIAGAFNDMLERIETAFATQRQFLDNVSHELRAPLTVIRGHVELIDAETDPDELRSTITLVTDEIERMNRLVEDLLVLARAERPGFLSLGPVDMAELTVEVHRKSSVLCTREWMLDVTDHVVAVADAQLLTQAMLQLALNACQHTSEGTPVHVGSRAEGGQICLWVHDRGPGVPREDVERVFERFVKGPHSREGSGLGLSIVSAIAQAHGGRARVAPGTVGARFEILIPLVAQPETDVTGRSRTGAAAS
jgi:two-component system, OmpR family, sensor kinase